MRMVLLALVTAACGGATPSPASGGAGPVVRDSGGVRIEALYLPAAAMLALTKP